MVRRITREQLKKQKEQDLNLRVVNVLPEESFQKKHIPGSINIPLNDIGKIAPKRLNKNDKIVLYCANFDCAASPKAAEKLEQMGYQHVYDFEGGIDDWTKAGYPLVEAT